MHTIRAEYPDTWDDATVYTLADLHIGDPHAMLGLIGERLKTIEEDPRGLVVLNGDLMNTALKTSVSDVYSEVMTPMQQINYLVELLKPIKHKIIGCTCGNHEKRIYRNDGIDTMRLVCRELGIEDRYDPDGVLIFCALVRRKRTRARTTSRPFPCMLPMAAAAGARKAQRLFAWQTWPRLWMPIFSFMGMYICQW